MADKNESPQVRKIEETSAQNSKDRINGRQNRRGLIIGLSIAGLVLVGGLVAGGLWMVRTITDEKSAASQQSIFGRGLSTRFSDNVPFGYGRAIQTEITDDKVTTTVYTYQTGVVVAVNSDSVVIAGNGKQTTIKTNSDTTYVNDKKPAVNDTVIVAGTTDNNVTTATQIRVANRT